MRALFSLSDIKNCHIHAKGLIDLGWEIIATRETADYLKKCDIEVNDISEFFNIDSKFTFPPTLHPEIESALTDSPINKDKGIDLLYDITYPLTDGNDVGGHTLLALAAKGNRIVVPNADEMHIVLQALKDNNNSIGDDYRQSLIKKVYLKILLSLFFLSRVYRHLPAL